MSFSLSFCPTLIVPRPIPPLSSSQLVPLQAPLSRSLSLELYKHSFNGLIRAKYSSPFSHVSSGELRMRIQTMRLSHGTKRKFVSQFPIDYMQLPLRRWKTFPSLPQYWISECIRPAYAPIDVGVGSGSSSHPIIPFKCLSLQRS